MRIEKDRFYAMFGQTQATSITELTKYDRIINGAKTEYRGDRASATAFASELTGVHTLVELNADALSGAYATKTPIKVNTEVVSIVTRSSSQRDRILDRKVLSRYLDYDIDYALGTIRLKAPGPGVRPWVQPELHSDRVRHGHRCRVGFGGGWPCSLQAIPDR